MNTQPIQGIFTPNVVPFTADHQINEDELRRYVNWLIGKGVHGLYPNGSTGEFIRRSFEQRVRVVEIIADEMALRGFKTGTGIQPISAIEEEHLRAISNKLACLLKECGFSTCREIKAPWMTARRQCWNGYANIFPIETTFDHRCSGKSN